MIGERPTLADVYKLLTDPEFSDGEAHPLRNGDVGRPGP